MSIELTMDMDNHRNAMHTLTVIINLGRVLSYSVRN